MTDRIISIYASVTDIPSDFNGVARVLDTDTLYIGNGTAINAISGINEASISYVEVSGNDTTARLGNRYATFATINAAIAALPSTGGIVNIGSGVFAPVSQLYTVEPAGAYVKDRLIFVGQGMPDFNDTHTGLIGGTIIKGPFRFDRDYVQVYNLGVDSGSDVCTALYAGVEQNGLSFANNGPVIGKPPRKGIIVNNVSAICKNSSALSHAAIFENVQDELVSNIKTCFGTHGTVIKSSSGIYSRINGRGHGTDGLIVKSDGYGQAQGVNISNVYLTSVNDQDGRGVIFDGSSTYRLDNIVINGYVADNVGSDITIVTGSTANGRVGNIDVNGMKTLNGTTKGTIGANVDLNTIVINGKPLQRDRLSFVDKKEPINSDGMSGGVKPFNSPQAQATVSGTRTSDTVFTRTAGTWIANSLVGQYAFSYATATPKIGVWLPITANTTNTLTVDGVLNATGTSVITSPWNPISETFAHGQGATAFKGGCYDGESLWLAPKNSANILKVNPHTGAMTSYAHGQGTNAFSGSVFDGVNIWFIPSSSVNIVKLNPKTGGITTYAHGQAVGAFSGGCFDGKNVWMAPAASTVILSISVSTGVITTYAHSQSLPAYSGCLYDGASVWFIPNAALNIIKLNPALGVFDLFPYTLGTGAFQGGSYDGENIVLASNGYTGIAKLDPKTGKIFDTSIIHGQGGTAYLGAIYDGEATWLVPFSAAELIRLDPSSNSYTKYPHGQGDTAFAGAIYDGTNVWLVPYSSPNLVKIELPRSGIKTTVTPLTSITATAPGTPDYAIANLTQTTPFGFVSSDEGQTVLSVIKNLQERLAIVEMRVIK